MATRAGRSQRSFEVSKGLGAIRRRVKNGSTTMKVSMPNLRLLQELLIHSVWVASTLGSVTDDVFR